MVRIWSGGRQRPWESRALDAEWSMLAFSEAVVSGFVRGRLKRAALEVGLRRRVLGQEGGARSVVRPSLRNVLCLRPRLLGHDRNWSGIGLRIGLGAATLVWGDWKRHQNWSGNACSFHPQFCFGLGWLETTPELVQETAAVLVRNWSGSSPATRRPWEAPGRVLRGPTGLRCFLWVMEECVPMLGNLLPFFSPFLHSLLTLTTSK